MITGALQRVRGLVLEDGMKARALRGSALTIVSFGADNVIRLAANLVLTRLLFPEAFGLMALVGVTMTAVAMFTDFGIRGSVIHDERGEDPDFLATAWTIQIGRGVMVWLVVCALALPAARFYEEPQLAALLPVASFMAVLQSVASMRGHVQNRNVVLGRLTAIQIGGNVFGAVSMITLAWLLESVWALVLGSLMGTALTSLLTHVALPGRPDRLGFDRDAASRLFRFGRWVFVATLATFFVKQGDRAVLGKFVELSEIAIYNIGYFLAAVPLLLGQAFMDRIFQPLYARRPPAESAENRRQIGRARMALTGVLYLGSATLALISIPLIEFLYDPRYHAAGPIMTLIALALMPGLATMSYERLLLSMGDTRRYAFLMITAAVVQLFFLIWAASAYGVVGVALTPALGTVVIYPLLVRVIAPWKAWDPRHDAAAAAFILVTVAAVAAVHGETLVALFEAL